MHLVGFNEIYSLRYILQVQHKQDHLLRLRDTLPFPVIVGSIAADNEYSHVSVIVILRPCSRERLIRNWLRSDCASSVCAHTAEIFYNACSVSLVRMYILN